MQVSKTVQTPRGPLRADDIARCAAPTFLCRVLLIVKTTYSGAADRFWAVVAPFATSAGDNACDAQPLPSAIADLELLSAPLCYARVGGKIYV
jgi:hypothetical protein